MNYRGIIIRESLDDLSLLDEVKILKTWLVNERTSNEWHMLKVQIPEKEIHDFVKKLENSLKGYEPWYAHFYHEDPKKNNLIVVFYKKHFNGGKSDKDLAEVITYGIQQSIPQEQMDIKPRDIFEETW